MAAEVTVKWGSPGDRRGIWGCGAGRDGEIGEGAVGVGERC